MIFENDNINNSFPEIHHGVVVNVFSDGSVRVQMWSTLEELLDDTTSPITFNLSAQQVPDTCKQIGYGVFVLYQDDTILVIPRPTKGNELVAIRNKKLYSYT